MRPTPTTRTDPRLTRALAFERAMHAAVGRVVRTAWGQAFLDPRLSRCYERNAAWPTAGAGGWDAAALDRDVERLFAAAGLGHRRVVLEPTDARLAAGLARLGYGSERHLFQGFAGPAPAPPRAAVEEVGIDVVAAGNERYLRTDPDTAPFGRDDTVRAHLVEHHRTYGSAGATERCFAVTDGDGAAKAWAKLWLRDGAAQVEDVVCLHEHRGHGYGRDVVAAATRAALDAAPELLFIVADADDWPKALYARMGYVPIGTRTLHTRHAPGHLWGAPQGGAVPASPQSAGRGSRRRPPA